MAEQRQPFRIRLPWLAAAQPAPAVPRPSQATQAPSQLTPPPRPSQGTQAPSQQVGSQTEHPPAQPPPPPASSARTESPPPSQSQGTSKLAQQPQERKQSQGPPATPSQTVTQIKATSRPASTAEVSSKPQEATKALPQFPSPSRGITQQSRSKATTGPTAKSSQAKPPSPTKKPTTITSEISQNTNEVRKRGTSKPFSEEPKPAFEEVTTKAVSKLSAEEPSAKQEPKSLPVNDLYTTSFRTPKQVLKGTFDRLRKEVIEKEVKNSETPIIKQREKGQQSEEEVYDIKEVFQKFENSGRATEGEIHNHHERVAKFPHKHSSTGGQRASFQKEVKENLSKSVHKQGAQRERYLLNEKPFSIVTLSGENTGAIMHINSEAQKKQKSIHIHRGYKIKSDEITETTNDGEGSSSKRKSKDKMIPEELATKSYVNNNTQGINNSLVFSSNIEEKNPGVHMVLSRNAIEPTKPGKERGILDTHKVEMTRTPAHRLAYAPTIRRRCLQGLFLESSDSDAEKPRRHGCRIRCTQNEI